MNRSTLLPALGLCLAVFACSDDDGGDADGSAPVVPTKLAIVADWLNGSLSYVDVDKLAAGTARDALVTATVDLSAYPPGPIDLAITPDKKTALVSSSTGFFAIPGSSFLLGGVTLPSGPGKLLWVDIASGKVAAELDAGPGPMAIQITPDGKRAVAANFGSGSLSNADGTLVVLDLESKQVIDRVPAGLFPEELAFDETGTVAIYGYGSAGSLRSFSVADPRGTLSSEIALKGDSAGVAFFPGTKIAFAVQAPSVLDIVGGGASNGGYSVVDVSAPMAPKVLQDVRPDDAIGYPVVAAKNRGSVLVPVSQGGRLLLREYKLAGQ